MTRGSTCLVPRPYYSARPKRFGSRGPSEKCEAQAKIFKTETAHAVGLQGQCFAFQRLKIHRLNTHL